MRVDNVGVKLAFEIPVGSPDRNGIVYSEEAVKKALASAGKGLPIIFHDNEISSGRIIGNTVGKPRIEAWDSENHLCKVTVDGVIRYGGSECAVDEIKDNMVTDLKIVSFGLSV